MAGIQNEVYGNVSATEPGLKNDPELVSLTGNVVPQDIKWKDLGVHVGSSPPGTMGTYAQWVAGSVEYWAWKEIP